MSTTKQATGFVTQQLQHGAYWDAVPPFYSFTTLQGPLLTPETQSAFPKWEGRHAVKIPKDLAMQLLWQVKLYEAKLEFLVDETFEGYDVGFSGIATESNKFTETWQLPALTSEQFGIIAAQNFESRELKLPQGDLKWIKTISKEYTDEIPAGTTEQLPYISLITENYSALNSVAVSQVTTAWGTKALSAITEYHVVADIYPDVEINFQAEKQKAFEAIDDAISKEHAALLEMKISNEKSLYLDLKKEIERQITSFQSWSAILRDQAEAELQKLQQTYNELNNPPDEGEGDGGGDGGGIDSGGGGGIDGGGGGGIDGGGGGGIDGGGDGWLDGGNA